MPKRRILFVCRGNTCRSPMAAGLARSRARDAGRDADFIFDSAGVAPDMIGRNADPRAVRCIEARGIDISSHRSRPVTSADFEKFDMVLALDHSVQTDLTARAPAGRGHVVRSLMSFAPAVGVDEVPDPWYGAADDYEHALDLISEAIDGLLRALP